MKSIKNDPFLFPLENVESAENHGWKKIDEPGVFAKLRHEPISIESTCPAVGKSFTCRCLYVVVFTTPGPFWRFGTPNPNSWYIADVIGNTNDGGIIFAVDEVHSSLITWDGYRERERIDADAGSYDRSYLVVALKSCRNRRTGTIPPVEKYISYIIDRNFDRKFALYLWMRKKRHGVYTNGWRVF